MNFLKRFSLFEIGLITTILCIHLYAAFSDAYNFPNAWYTRDDAYYYFKVAQNITEGLGSTFDGINLTNGYHPLWMIICIPIFALARFDVILPLRVLLMVLAGFNVVTAIMIYRLIKSNLSHAVALLAASFWAFNLYIHFVIYKSGLESAVAAFTIVLFIYKLSQFENEWRANPITRAQLAALSFLAVLVMFSRLDLVFLAIVSGIWIIFRGKPIRFLLPLDIVIIFLSMTSSVALRAGITDYNIHYAAQAISAVLLALAVKLISLYFFGVYQHPRAASAWKTIGQTILALTTSTVITAILYAILVQLGIVKNLPRSTFVMDLGISLLLILALRLVAYSVGNKNVKSSTHPISPLAELQISWKKWLNEGIIYYGILGGALALYMLYNKITFGTSSPVSGQIKRWWGTMGNTAYERPAFNWPAFFGLDIERSFDVWQPLSILFKRAAKILYPIYPGSNTLDERYYIAMFIFVLLAIILLIANAHRALRAISRMALLPLAAGCGIQILSYSTTAYGGAKEWYWVSEMIFIILAGSLLIHLILRPLQKIKPILLSLETASILIGIFFAYTFGNYVVNFMPHKYFPEDRPYMEVLPFLEENTPPGSIIGMTGGGNVGYFIKDRTIVNMDGLINSNDYFHALQNKEAPAYLREHGLQIIFANAELLTTPPYYGQFDPYLSRFGSYGGKGLLHLLEKPKQ